MLSIYYWKNTEKKITVSWKTACMSPIIAMCEHDEDLWTTGFCVGNELIADHVTEESFDFIAKYFLFFSDRDELSAPKYPIGKRTLCDYFCGVRAIVTQDYALRCEEYKLFAMLAEQSIVRINDVAKLANYLGMHTLLVKITAVIANKLLNGQKLLSTNTDFKN